MAALNLTLRSVGYQLDNLSKWRAFQGSLVDNLREQFGLIGCLCHEAVKTTFRAQEHDSLPISNTFTNPMKFLFGTKCDLIIRFDGPACFELYHVDHSRFCSQLFKYNFEQSNGEDICHHFACGAGLRDKFVAFYSTFS